ncbi:MAG: tyrosine-type recombinase/integrase [Nitrosomonas sp.]|nr:tyrosine-type recombinase/integrase [Nitrosomonas sp.]
MINYITPRDGNTLLQSFSPDDTSVSEVDKYGFSGEVKEYTEKLLNLFRLHMRGCRNNQENSVGRALGCIRSFMQFTQRPIWEWTKRDLPAFFEHKNKELDGDLSISTQSGYVTYLRQLQNYLFSDKGLRNEIHTKFNVQLQEWIDGTNSPVIKGKNRKRKKLTQAVAPEEFAKILAEFDAQIKLAFETDSKSAYPLFRDKVIATVIYEYGLRVSEAVALHTWNFQPDPKYPQFKNYAILTLIGKGGYEGSVHLLDPAFVGVMDCYLQYIRSHFQSEKTVDGELLFYSERGGSLVDEQFRRRLQKIANQAGIKKKISPHCLRRSHGTDAMDLLGAVGAQKQLRHASIQTTFEGYYRPDPDEYGRNIANAIGNFAAARNKQGTKEEK